MIQPNAFHRSVSIFQMTEPEPVADPYRALLKISVSSLCTELGYTSAEAAALETLTELTQSFVTELGRSARAFTELAGRVEPVSADILLALLEMGVGVAGLHNYAQRIGRLTVPTPAQLTAAKAPNLDIQTNLFS